MDKQLKEKVLSFVEIAKECPENLQEICFELLLSNYLNPQTFTSLLPEQRGDDSKGENPPAPDPPAQNDILESDLHVKAKQFLKKSGITIEHINQILYKENDEFLPLFDDLKTTKASESQIRIGLIHSLINGIKTGNFEFSGEEVRSETQIRKCYDMTNYSSNFKNNKDLFENFEKYDKKSPIIKLSNKGKDELANTIKELQ